MQDNYSFSNEENHQKIFDYWKETGKWEELKYHTYEQIVELNGYLDTNYLNGYVEKYHKHMPLLDDEDF